MEHIPFVIGDLLLLQRLEFRQTLSALWGLEIGLHISLSAYAFDPLFVCPMAHNITHFYLTLTIPLLHTFCLTLLNLECIQDLPYIYIYSFLLFCTLLVVCLLYFCKLFYPFVDFFLSFVQKKIYQSVLYVYRFLNESFMFVKFYLLIL